MPAGGRAAFTTTLVVLLGIVGSLLGPDARAAAPVTVPVEVQAVAPGHFQVVGRPGAVSQENQGFNSNAGFVVTDAGVVVFDALGTPALGARLRALVAATGQPIRHVVLSHYHADHVYGLQALIGPGVETWANVKVREYLTSAAAQARLEERRQSLAPWVDGDTRLVAPDHDVAVESAFTLGGKTFRLLPAGPAHTPEDLMMLVEPDGVLYVGDLMFTGRIPFVADADTSAWIRAIDRVLALAPKVVVGGHGPASRDAVADLSLTRDYLRYLREQITAAFEDGLDFDEAYGRIDWSAYEKLPAFSLANRRNAYQTYLNVEREALQQVRPAR